MAHSNRKAKRDARGGLTKNQASKKSRSSITPEERLRNLLEWNRQRENKQANPEVGQTLKKVRKANMWRSTQLRRIVALKNLEDRRKKTDDKTIIVRMESEIKTLKSRINIAA